MAQNAPPPPDALLPLVTYALAMWHLALAADYLNARFALTDTAPALTAALVLPQIWAVVAWGMAVWLGTAASLFLLARDDASTLLYFAAAVAAAVAAVGDTLAGGAGDLLGLPRLGVWAALVIVPALGWLYTRARHASGHLT